MIGRKIHRAAVTQKKNTISISYDVNKAFTQFRVKKGFRLFQNPIEVKVLITGERKEGDPATKKPTREVSFIICGSGSGLFCLFEYGNIAV